MKLPLLPLRKEEKFLKGLATTKVLLSFGGVDFGQFHVSTVSSTSFIGSFDSGVRELEK